MSSTPLLVTGTYQGRWPLVAAEILRGTPWALVDGAAPMAASDAASETAGDGVCLLFVEAPAEGLADALSSAAVDDPTAWLDAWVASSKGLLRIVQRHRDRCVVIDVAEALHRPVAARQRLATLAGMAAPDAAPTMPAVPTPDPLCHAAAAALVNDHVAAQRLYLELAACCDWLEPGAPPPPERTIDATAIVRGLSAVRQREAEIRALHAARTASQEQLQSLQARLEATAAEHADLLKQVAAASRDSDLILEHLHETQEGLERAEKELQRLRAAPSASSPSQAPAPTAAPPLDVPVAVKAPTAVPIDETGHVQIDELVVTGTRDERPHREISFTLRGGRIGPRRISQASVRLVEHHGHPGLVVLTANGATTSPLLEAWSADGTEGERAYMLFVPSDDRAQKTLRSLNSGDWLTVLALAFRMERTLAAAPPLQRGTWLSLAVRLREQLQTLPALLRFDAISAEPARETASAAVRLAIANVTWGARRIATLHLHWQPTGAGAGLALSRAPDGAEPLISWPDDSVGDAPDLLWLPPASGATGSNASPAPWMSLRQADREFLQVLMAALPDLVSKIDADVAGLPAGVAARASLAAAAGAATARRLASSAGATSSVLRRIARSVVRRRGAGQ